MSFAADSAALRKRWFDVAGMTARGGWPVPGIESVLSKPFEEESDVFITIVMIDMHVDGSET